MDDELTKLFEKSKPLTGSIDAQLFLDEAYDITYGIHDHRLPDGTPLDLVAIHPAEETYKSSLLQGYIKRFRLNSVNKHFGCSINEFLQLPKYVADELLEQSVQANRASSVDADSIEDKLRNEFGKLGM